MENKIIFITIVKNYNIFHYKEFSIILSKVKY